MANQYVNHVVVNNQDIIDLRSDTVDAAHLAQGFTAHDKSGAPITGTMAESGGGIPEPSPISAGDTPVWMDITTHLHSGTTTRSYYNYVCKKAGTYRLYAPFSANGTTRITATINVNGVTKETATFTAHAPNVNFGEASVDATLSVGDVVSVSVSLSSTLPRVLTLGLIVSIDWDNGLI